MMRVTILGVLLIFLSTSRMRAQAPAPAKSKSTDIQPIDGRIDAKRVDPNLNQPEAKPSLPPAKGK